MKVIMLRGPGSCGKTETLNIVYNHLFARSGTSIITPKSQLGKDPRDFETVLNYGGVKVAIFTMGDFSIYVVNAMQKYSVIADVLIIACNSKFSRPIAAMNNYTPHAIVPKTRQPIIAQRPIDDQNAANKIITSI
ncbi:hypothetical protein AGMMS4952_07090 [Spirochaetia bacterium]|nr:hypothetical protein AGMMS4952_07090 [Spirochaetia bacterium]